MKLHGTCLQTHQVDEMVAFYMKVFGYEPTVDGGVDFRFMDNQLIIYKLSDNLAHSTSNAALIYAVDDTDSEYRRLKSLGIANDPPTNKPWGVRLFMINDPDGNIVSLFKNLVV